MSQENVEIAIAFGGASRLTLPTGRGTMSRSPALLKGDRLKRTLLAAKEAHVYVVVQHKFRDPQTAFSRGEKLVKNEGAPTGVRGLQFYPARDGSGATCLWESDSVEDVQGYVDSTLGDSSENLCYEVDAEQAFARQPGGIPESAAIGA